MSKPLAVFDVDGTIFRSSLFIQLVEKLIAVGELPANIKQGYEPEHIAWLNREGSYADYIQAMVEVFHAHIKGLHYGTFADVAREVVDEHAKRTYVYPRDLIKRLRKEGYYLLAVSHSPKTILDMFCPTLGFDKVYGMVYDIGPEDRFTGTIVERHLILNKANIVRRVVEQGEATLEGSVGVGDTESDVSFLEMVESPICFNPNSVLYRHATLNKWKVVIERKDVVYEL